MEKVVELLVIESSLVFVGVGVEDGSREGVQ